MKPQKGHYLDFGNQRLQNNAACKKNSHAEA
nr:MAG TPA: hypothetical protein [Caudoviricetes sp.]